MSDVEFLDLVNERDEVIESVPRDEVYAKRLHNYRAVHGFVVNNEGRLWIPRRAAHKKLFPNALDYSVSGHVSAGESYDTAFARETQEELNIDLAVTPWKRLGAFTPSEGAHCFIMLYEIECGDVTLNTNEFSEAFWLTPTEAIEKINAENTAKDELAALIEKWYV